ncbi:MULTISPECIES: TetR/AcrR family transcriptional regulator [unclassified Cyanobium]|uniref:TetR/AcrR family transcriptional regulator n=1 Tax=unclassified Cyanobium TaxID=2627006 RepID=UPI0020CD7C25|nr:MULTISPECIES: TetR/AcrR family transcriptional regulator [unclassified Cyanobium]MCP9835735.1 TetR/AcrR family transcriptional regulator [Cyanobium sp. La Preciosa 7G6]MCP9938507.1 TetR/AcrR family transcriptional regulator [Cyanobium sp. Aljojuca 7A6]
MRYPTGHKQAVRARILEAAAEELRRQGLSGIGIPALMKRAGLTHGAFYAHFPNRDALVAEAIRAASASSVDGPLAESLPLEQTLALYLSPDHLAHPERGCVIAALGGEGARQPAPVRQAFAAAARGLLALIDRKLHPRQPSPVPSDGALRLVSSMVGAVLLARLVDDPVLARRLLDAAVPPLDSGAVGSAQARD